MPVTLEHRRLLNSPLLAATTAVGAPPLRHGCLPLPQVLQKFQYYILAVPQDEEVDEIGHRLRVAGAGPARDDEVFALPAVLAAHRDAREIEHVEHAGIAKLVLEREADHVEGRKAVPALDREQRQAVFADLLLQIEVRREDPLAPNLIVFI